MFKSISISRFAAMAVAAAAIMTTTACTRIETGTVGIRTNISKEIQKEELKPGTWNQTVVGEIEIVPVKEVAVKIQDNKPIASDGSQMSDMDLTVVYSLNPESVAELRAAKSASHHSVFNGSTYLMHARIGEIAKNEAYKEVRKFGQLEAVDNRTKIEDAVKVAIVEQLGLEGVGDSIKVNAVQITSLVPDQEILRKASQAVRAQQELDIKKTEVKIAEEEAKRMDKLAVNSERSIAYMNAQANVTLANAVAAGKVNTMIVPANFSGLGNFSGK